MTEPAPIEVVSPLRQVPFPAEWYGLASSRHFWFEWRLRVALALMRSAGLDPAQRRLLIEVGAGSGVLRDQLEARSRWVVDIAELCFEALERASPGRGRRLYYDVCQEREELLGRYDAAVLFDVIEHVGEARALVRATARHLRPGGLLFVNVPALPWLFGEYDRQAGHLRRYRPGTLRLDCEVPELEVLDIRYWGLSLVPLLLARKLLVRRGGRSPIRTGFRPPGALVHGLLKALMRCETAVARTPPLGSSLLLAARRRVQTPDELLA